MKKMLIVLMALMLLGLSAASAEQMSFPEERQQTGTEVKALTDLPKTTYVQQYGIMVESWYPFGGRGHTQEHFTNETIVRISSTHGKTPAQIILRWQIQDGYITIPGSSNPDHIAENYDVFDFELTNQEMMEIRDLDQQARYENW